MTVRNVLHGNNEKSLEFDHPQYRYGIEKVEYHHSFECPHYKDEVGSIPHDDCVEYCGNRVSGVEYSYEGATLYEYERNGYSDSDWYATVYDDKTGTVRTFEYSTTRFACYGNSARVDATPAYIAKAIEAQLIVCEEIWHKQNEAQCKEIQIGREVKVLGGRKHKNKTGLVRWIGISPFKYSKYDDTCRLETAEGESVFMDLMRVEVIDPDQYLKGEAEMKEAMKVARSNMIYKWGQPAAPSIVFVVAEEEMIEQER